MVVVVVGATQCLFWNPGLVGCGLHEGVGSCPVLCAASALPAPANRSIPVARVSAKTCPIFLILNNPFLLPPCPLPQVPPTIRPIRNNTESAHRLRAWPPPVNSQKGLYGSAYGLFGQGRAL